MRRMISFTCATVSLALGLAACGEATVDDVQQRTAPIISRMMTETQQSMRAANKLGEVKDLVESLEAMIPGFGKLIDASDNTGKGDWLEELEQEMAAAEINAFLAKHIFTEANVDSAGPDSVTFMIRGALICQELASSTCVSAPGSGVSCSKDPGGVAQCTKMIDQLQIRLVATLVDADGVDLQLRVGPGAVLTLRLRSTSITLELDIDGAVAATKHVAGVVGESVYLPQTMQGALSVALVLNGPGDLSLQTAVTRAIRVEQSGKDALRLKVAQRNPLTEVRMRRDVPSLSARLDAGAVELLLPAREAFKGASGALELLLAGSRASLTVDPQGLTIKEVGLGQGPSWLKLDGKTVAQVELVPFGLRLLPWQQGRPRLAVTPELDLRVTLKLAQLQPYLTDPVEPWALDDTYRLSLSGGGSPEVAPVRAGGGFPDGGLQVLKGNLSLQSFVHPAKISVPTGSCLRWSDALAPGSHPLLGHFQSVACP